MKKTFLSFMLAIVIAFSIGLVACSGGNKDSGSGTTPEPELRQWDIVYKDVIDGWQITVSSPTIHVEGQDTQLEDAVESTGGTRQQFKGWAYNPVSWSLPNPPIITFISADKKGTGDDTEIRVYALWYN